MELFDSVTINIFIIIYMCIFVLPPFLSHSPASSVKHLYLQHIQVWLILTSFISLHLLCLAMTDCLCTSFSLPMWDGAFSVSSSFIFEILSSLSQAPQKEGRRTKEILLFPTSAPLWPLPYPIPLLQFPEESSCYANFALFPFLGLGHTQAYLCAGCLWDLHTVHKPPLGTYKLKFSEVAN